MLLPGSHFRLLPGRRRSLMLDADRPRAAFLRCRDASPPHNKKPREKRGQSVVANGVISDSGGRGGLRGPTRLLGPWSRRGRKRFNAALTGMGATTRVGGRGGPLG